MEIKKLDGTPFTIFTLNGVQEVLPETIMISIAYNGKPVPAELLTANGIFLPCSVAKIPEDFEFSCMMVMGQ